MLNYNVFSRLPIYPGIQVEFLFLIDLDGHAQEIVLVASSSRFLFLVDPGAHALTIQLVVVGVLIIMDRAFELLPTPFALRGGGTFEGGWRGQSNFKGMKQGHSRYECQNLRSYCCANMYFIHI